MSWSRWVAENGKLPVVNFSRRRHRHPGRRRAHDAARRRGRVRGLGHLQERRPADARRRHRARPPPTTATPAILAEVSRRSGRRHARHRRRAHAGGAQDPAPRLVIVTAHALSDRHAPATGSCRPTRGRRGRARAGLTVGVLALQGDFREHRARARALGAATREVRLPAASRGPRRARHPRRREHDDQQAHAGLRARRAHQAPSRGRGAVFGTCAGLITVAPRHRRGLSAHARPHRHRRAAQRLRPPGAQLRGRPGRGGPSRRRRCAPCSSAPRGSSAPAPACRCSRATEGHAVAARQGDVLVTAFHPELTGDTRLHGLFIDMIRRRQGAAPSRPARRSRAPPASPAAPRPRRAEPLRGRWCPQCPGIPSGPRSSTRRARPTPSAASSSASSRAPSPWPRVRAAPTPT